MCPFLFSNHLDGEERVGCFALFVYLVSRDCCVSLPHDAAGFLWFVIVVFPDHTHLLFTKRLVPKSRVIGCKQYSFLLYY